jgi:replication-associated recombination protein RarA
MTVCEVKYAPKQINDVVFNNSVYEQQLKLIFQGFKTRHLFLSGANGSGKSTIAVLIAEELTRHCPDLLLNDSIDFVMSQNDIYEYFMRMKHIAYLAGAGDSDRLVIVFNELDKFEKSLGRLWTVMDRMKNELLVIITTNYPMKFENAIRSRCDKFHFTRITPAEFLERAQYILEQEQVILPDANVLHYLTTWTVKTSDVRDYMAVLDRLIFMSQHNMPLPAVPAAPAVSAVPTLTIVK